MTHSSKSIIVSVLTMSLFASAAVANPDHHDGKGQAEMEETPFVDQSGMRGMSGMEGMSGMSDMGETHMQMMQMMIKMHMSMMGQMHGGGSAQLKSLFANGATPAEIMLQFDANGDGTLDLSEFQVWDKQAHKLQIVDRFQALDADGVDAISIDELTAAQTAGGMSASMDSGMTDSMMQDEMTDDESK